MRKKRWVKREKPTRRTVVAISIASFPILMFGLASAFAGLGNRHLMGPGFAHTFASRESLVAAIVVWVVTTWLLARLIYFMLSYRRELTPNEYCRGCGYDLTLNTSGRCPECNTSIRVDFDAQALFFTPWSVLRGINIAIFLALVFALNNLYELLPLISSLLGLPPVSATGSGSGLRQYGSMVIAFAAVVTICLSFGRLKKRASERVVWLVLSLTAAACGAGYSFGIFRGLATGDWVTPLSSPIDRMIRYSWALMGVCFLAMTGAALARVPRGRLSGVAWGIAGLGLVEFCLLEYCAGRQLATSSVGGAVFIGSILGMPLIALLSALVLALAFFHVNRAIYQRWRYDRTGVWPTSNP